jgi:hypothetical protein
MHAKRIFTAAVAALAIAFGSNAGAQEKAEMPAPMDYNTGAISLTAGVDFTTHYFFRGIHQEDQGLITQPYADIAIQLCESASFNFGIWNSFHDNNPGGTTEPDNWYEADLYFGFTFGIAENWDLGVAYTAYTSPNSLFNTVQEISASISYDDSALMGDWALSPKITVAREVSDEADAGNSAAGNNGTDEGTYIEISIEPSFKIVESKDMPLTLSIPVKLGLGDNYYESFNANGSHEDDAFGYFSAGLVLSTPLSFIPPQFGAWEAHAGVTFIFLGNSAENLTDDGEDFEAIGTFGISMSY